MKNISKNSMIAFGLLAIMGVFPFFANSAWIAIGTTFLVFSAVAFSQDIILGRAGAFHMGHAAFFGIGAYTTAILNVHFGWPILATWAPAVIIPVVIALLVTGPIIHLRGDYLLVATIGINIVFIQILENDLFGLTGGPNGIFGIEVIKVFGFEFFEQIHMYYLAFILLGITLFIMKSLDSSKFGRAMFYINKDDIAAQSMGISIRYYKLYAFAIGAGIAGAAGSMFAVQYSAVSPEAFNVLQSIMFFTIVLVGGSASLPGVLIGTFVMFILPEVFREFETARYLVFGVAMILTMILRPRGIWPVKFGNIPSFLKKDVK
ncbi:MAG TPA: branched-chain amino acid ABC transporter permease [Sulfurospirillum sp. UBA11407]|jgi:branched-chain amino acid transport system permease protein|nr:MAG TPA: branched-chain amino acid ABC transporter permease [Sulfurospirillum sp. UBA11407]